jgi:P-type Mg2+ transporter
MLTFSPLSSMFDLATFAALWWALGTDSPGEQAAFLAGWFTEGLLSQVLIVLVLRTRQAEILRFAASRPVVAAAVTVMSIGLLLPFSPLADALRMTALPLGYFPWLLAILLGYVLAAHATKARYLRRGRSWLCAPSCGGFRASQGRDRDSPHRRMARA